MSSALIMNLTSQRDAAGRGGGGRGHMINPEESSHIRQFISKILERLISGS